MKPILFGQTATRNTCTVQYDAASSVAHPLSGRSADCASDVVQSLADFGAPRGVAKPLPAGRFLEALSGRDPLRVMRAARDADDPRDAYGWAR